MIVCPVSPAIAFCIRRTPKTSVSERTVMNCTSAPVTKMIPVQPNRINPMVIVRSNAVSTGRTSSKPTVKTVSTVM